MFLELEGGFLFLKRDKVRVNGNKTPNERIMYCSKFIQSIIYFYYKFQIIRINKWIIIIGSNMSNLSKLSNSNNLKIIKLSF